MASRKRGNNENGKMAAAYGGGVVKMAGEQYRGAIWHGVMAGWRGCGNENSGVASAGRKCENPAARHGAWHRK